jgi:hypothetical protein
VIRNEGDLQAVGQGVDLDFLALALGFPHPQGGRSVERIENRQGKPLVAELGGGAADIDGNGSVGASDIAVLLSAWGACP